METFIRKQLKMKAHWVPKVEETLEGVVVWIDRLGQRPLRCGRCGLAVCQRARFLWLANPENLRREQRTRLRPFCG